MDAFTELDAVASPVMRQNIDTDIVIPHPSPARRGAEPSSALTPSSRCAICPTAATIPSSR